MSRKNKRRSPKLQVNANLNELNWLNDLDKNNPARGKTGQLDKSPDTSPEEEQVTEKSVQIVVKIPQYLYDYLQQKNMDLTRVVQESLTTAIILAQNRHTVEELKIDIIKSS